MKLHAIEGVRRLVLVDGVFAPKLSDLGNLEKGLAIRTLREALEAGDAALQAQLFTPDNANPMVALNSAMMTDGVVIDVADGVVLTQPLQIVHIASAQRRRRCSRARCSASARTPVRRWWKAMSRPMAPRPIRSMTP